jgi:hypothetical protein
MKTWQALRRSLHARPIEPHFREPDGLGGRPPHMHNAFSAILGLIAPLYLAATISNATAAPAAKAAEDPDIAARGVAIEKLSKIQDRGTSDALRGRLKTRFAPTFSRR